MSGTTQPTQKIQQLGDIRPMTEQKGAAKKTTPEQKEYEEGKRFLENGDFGQAAGALHSALISFEKKGDSNGIANACNQLGNLCLQKGNFADALNHYNRSYEICDAADDRMSIIAILQQRAAAYAGLQEYEKAVEDCLMIIAFHYDFRNPQGVVTVMEQMAEIYIQAGDKEKAVDTYRTIASIHANYKHKNIAQKFLDKAEELEGK